MCRNEYIFGVGHIVYDFLPFYAGLVYDVLGELYKRVGVDANVCPRLQEFVAEAEVGVVEEVSQSGLEWVDE